MGFIQREGHYRDWFSKILLQLYYFKSRQIGDGEGPLLHKAIYDFTCELYVRLVCVDIRSAF